MSMFSAGFGYDEEAVIQEADIEMAELEAAAAQAAALRRRGICVHGYGIGGGVCAVNRTRAELEASLTGRFEGATIAEAITCQDDIGAGRMLCLDCGEVVKDRFA